MNCTIRDADGVVQVGESRTSGDTAVVRVVLYYDSPSLDGLPRYEWDVTVRREGPRWIGVSMVALRIH